MKLPGLFRNLLPRRRSPFDLGAFEAQLDRNLASRKAMRAARSAAARKGWETRRGNHA